VSGPTTVQNKSGNPRRCHHNYHPPHDALDMFNKCVVDKGLFSSARPINEKQLVRSRLINGLDNGVENTALVVI
jgi:hypothetical protein